MHILDGVNGTLRKKVGFVNGILFGKFFPPHLGHVHCIETALRHCSKLFIVVCSTKNANPSGRDGMEIVRAANAIFSSLDLIIGDLVVEPFRNLWRHPCGGNGFVFAWEVKPN